MSTNWLFFPDADGWLASPESAPFPDEDYAIEAARRALRRDAAGALETQLLFSGRSRDDKCLRSDNLGAEAGLTARLEERPNDVPARIVIVHDEPDFADPLTAALRSLGHEVAIFSDPTAGWDALDEAHRVEVLVTRIHFPPGKPNGVSLARMARFKRRGIRIVFTAPPQFAGHAAELGEFIPMPASVSDVVDVVTRLLETGGGRGRRFRQPEV